MCKDKYKDHIVIVLRTLVSGTNLKCDDNFTFSFLTSLCFQLQLAKTEVTVRKFREVHVGGEDRERGLFWLAREFRECSTVGQLPTNRFTNQQINFDC